jgi:CCR4-NOT transcription complex subunit 3
MEKFKAVEKEMKTKAFSKEGLSAAAKLDPKEQEKEECINFIAEMVESLDLQKEKLEAEEETLQATVKRGKRDTGKADRLSEIHGTIERHKWHQDHLERLRRALENGILEPEKLESAKDDIRYYVDENHTPEFVEDDSLYEQFELDVEEDEWGTANDIERVSSQDAQSLPEEAADTTESRPTPSATKSRSSGEVPAVTARRPSATLKSPLPALATLHTPNVTTNISATSSSMKPAPLPTRPPGETLKYASAAAAAALSDKASIAPLPPPPGAVGSLAPLPSLPPKGSATSSPITVPALPIATQAAVPHRSPRPTPVEQVLAPVTRSPTLSHAATNSVPPTPALEKAETAAPARSKSSQAPAAIHETMEASPEPEQPRTPPGLSNANRTAGEPAIEAEEESIYHLPPGLQDLMQSFEITKSRSTVPFSPANQRLLEMSHQLCPNPSETDKPFHYTPQEKMSVPRYYPQEPSPIINDPALYSRIDTDTLFFIFYYRQGTYQQYLAAKALKGQSWRFHKQYQTWFQRHEEPKTITEDYEQGTYRFFDYESTW